MTLRKKCRTVKITSISTELFVQPACSVCEDMAGEHGEVAESVDAPLDNRNANLRCGELGNSSQCKSGLLHKLVLERGYESIQLQMDISVMRIRIVSPNGIM